MDCSTVRCFRCRSLLIEGQNTCSKGHVTKTKNAVRPVLMHQVEYMMRGYLIALTTDQLAADTNAKFSIAERKIVDEYVKTHNSRLIREIIYKAGY